MRALRFGGSLTVAVVAGAWLATPAVWSTPFLAAALAVAVAAALALAWLEVWG